MHCNTWQLSSSRNMQNAGWSNKIRYIKYIMKYELQQWCHSSVSVTFRWQSIMLYHLQVTNYIINKEACINCKDWLCSLYCSPMSHTWTIGSLKPAYCQPNKIIAFLTFHKWLVSVCVIRFVSYVLHNDKYMNGTNQNQSLGKSELRYYFIRLTKVHFMILSCNFYDNSENVHKTILYLNSQSILMLHLWFTVPDSFIGHYVGIKWCWHA